MEAMAQGAAYEFNLGMEGFRHIQACYRHGVQIAANQKIP